MLGVAGEVDVTFTVPRSCVKADRQIGSSGYKIGKQCILTSKSIRGTLEQKVLLHGKGEGRKELRFNNQ